MSGPPLRRDILRICSIGAVSGLMGCLANSRTSEKEATTTEKPETTKLLMDPPKFIIWAEEDLTLTVRVSEYGTDNTVYEKTQTLDGTEELTFEHVFEREPYDITLLMEEETIWQRLIQTCENLKLSVDNSGAVEIVSNSIC